MKYLLLQQDIGRGNFTVNPSADPTCFFPHIFVWGSCFWLCTPACLLPPASSRLLPLSAAHTHKTHSQHNLHTHTQLSHTQLTHNTTHTHKTYSHTTHSLTHTELTHTHTTHAHTHNLHTHTTYSHITYYRYVHSAWQAWHLATLTCILRGRHGTYGDIDLHFVWQAWHLWHWAVSGGALRWSPQPFAWQVWHLVAWTFT